MVSVRFLSNFQDRTSKNKQKTTARPIRYRSPTSRKQEHRRLGNSSPQHMLEEERRYRIDIGISAETPNYSIGLDVRKYEYTEILQYFLSRYRIDILQHGINFV